MAEVHRIIVQLRRPSATDPGQVSEGYYTVTGDELVMTYASGDPVDPDQFRRKLREGDNPDAIARILTKLVRRHMLGMSQEEEAFGRRLRYSDAEIA